MSTLFLCCGAVAREVLALRERYGWDAEVKALPASLHNRPERIPEEVRNQITRYQGRYDRVLVIYGDCGTGGELDRTLEDLSLERIEGPHCYEQFAGATEFAGMMQEEPGTFFLTDFLTASFDHLVLEGLGLDDHPELRDLYFGNYRRMVYLQQRPDPDLISQARQAAQDLQLPLEIKPTGYGEFEHRLVRAMSFNGSAGAKSDPSPEQT